MSHETKTNSHRRKGNRKISKVLAKVDSTSTSIVWNVLSQAIPKMSLSTPDNHEFRFFSMEYKPAILTTSNIAAQTYSKSWDSSDILQFSSYSAIFDQYIIDEVEVWVVPRNPASASGSATLNRGNYYTVVDYDDDNVLPSQSAALEYQNVTVTPAALGVYRKFVPHIAVGAFTGTFTGYQNLPPRWLDAASTTIKHYAFKIYADIADSVANETVYDLYSRVHYRFRNVR
jgi:hypothetical protein